MSGTALRKDERRQLLGHLTALGAPDPATRAEAALRAAEMVARKGLAWPALIPASWDAPASDTDTPPADWRAAVVTLLARPDIEPGDRAYLTKLAGWRAPGADGLRRLREIAGRMGVDLI